MTERGKEKCERISVRVVPGAKRERVETDKNGGVKVWVRAAARDGSANERVEELLADEYRVRRSAVRIVRGQKSRDKIIEVSL